MLWNFPFIQKTRFETPPKAGSPASPQCGFTFDRLLHNRVELEHFKSFLSERYASRDLLMWLDIEEFLHIPLSEDRIRRGKAQLIKSCYLHKQYFFSPVSPATKQQQKLVRLFQMKFLQHDELAASLTLHTCIDSLNGSW